MEIKKNISLQTYNSFQVNVRTAYFMSLYQVSDLQAIINTKPWSTLPKFILGSGSNILLTQHYKGLMIHNQLKGIHKIDENKQYVWLTIAAGENWHQLVLHCVKHNYGGIENLALIPGTVGAAPVQNIGAYGVEISSVIESVHTIDLLEGKVKAFNRKACEFDYRNSVFKNKYKGQYMITHVILKLSKQPVLNTDYPVLKKALDTMSSSPSIQSISQAVIKIRQRKLPDPNILPNAGSFFQNPRLPIHQFHSLKASHPNIPHYFASHNKVKISAAWLIEKCGWKGKTLGSAKVHAQQALVIINSNQAQGLEIKKLAEQIQSSVEKRFGIRLTPEVEII